MTAGIVAKPLDPSKRPDAEALMKTPEPQALDLQSADRECSPTSINSTPDIGIDPTPGGQHRSDLRGEA